MNQDKFVWFKRFLCLCLAGMVLTILLFDIAGLPTQSTTASIVRFYYKKPHTDYYFQPNGKTVIVIPDSHPGEWRAVVTINGFEIDTTVSSRFRDTHQSGDTIQVNYTVSRIIGHIRVTSVPDDQ